MVTYSIVVVQVFQSAVLQCNLQNKCRNYRKFPQKISSNLSYKIGAFPAFQIYVKSRAPKLLFFQFLQFRCRHLHTFIQPKNQPIEPFNDCRFRHYPFLCTAVENTWKCIHYLKNRTMSRCHTHWPIYLIYQGRSSFRGRRRHDDNRSSRWK